MSSIYERADIYDLLEDDEHMELYRKHWRNVLADKGIQNILDVSIGSGSVTLAIPEDVTLYGSDLSPEMLNNCRDKALKSNRRIILKKSDFRDLSCWEDLRFDCVASTGNSLPHIENKDVMKVMEEMDKHVKRGGYLYLDLRNWDKILRDRNRFYVYQPVFKDDLRINLVQVWDYNSENMMTFNLLYTFEKNGRIFQKEKFEEIYFTIKLEKILDKLKALNYKNIEINNFPDCYGKMAVENIDWLCIIAQKG